jgi:cystathionine gamma-lyase
LGTLGWLRGAGVFGVFGVVGVKLSSFSNRAKKRGEGKVGGVLDGVTMRIPPGASIETLCIHAGQEPDPSSGAVMTPIVLSTTFAQDGPGRAIGALAALAPHAAHAADDAAPRYDYSRAGNPTRAALEGCLAALEGAAHGVAFGSGCAATTAVLLMLKSGDHVLVGDDVYGGTFRIFDKVLAQFGLQASYLDMSDPRRVEAAIGERTRLIWMETPSNPLLKIFDVAAIADIARARGVIVAVDNTFATPMLQRPLALGASLSVHSTTKYLNGHSDVVGGAVMTSDDGLAERLRFLQKSVGGVPSPFDCYLVLRGLKTLAVRMKRHVESARVLADYLANHSGVSRVRYPGLESHEGHALAARQMSGPGGMISLELNGTLDNAVAFLRALRIFACAESLGGVESLAEHPALMTHASLPPETRRALGIGDGLIRLSVGLEDPADLIADLDHALARAR